MTEEQWDDIDGGWDEVDVTTGKKRRTRARGSRGKRRATAQSAPATEPPQQQTKKAKNRPRPANEGKAAAKPIKTAKPAWLFPLLAFGGAIAIFVLYLLATKK